MLAFLSRRISNPLMTNGSVKTYTRTILDQLMVNRTMTMCELPTSNQVLPIVNSLDSRASFWRFSTLGSISEHKFCNNKFNLFENISQQTVTRGTTLGKRSVLFWVITPRIVVFPYRLLWPVVCLEASVWNYHYTLRNNLEERRSHLLRGGSLKSRLRRG